MIFGHFFGISNFLSHSDCLGNRGKVFLLHIFPTNTSYYVVITIPLCINEKQATYETVQTLCEHEGNTER